MKSKLIQSSILTREWIILKYSNEEEVQEEKMDEDTSVKDDQLKSNVSNESRKGKGG